MRELYINKDYNPFGVSYFDIVNTELIKTKLSDRFSGVGDKDDNQTEITNAVNEEVLKFFIQGRQFTD
jgi:hypothetical protein